MTFRPPIARVGFVILLHFLSLSPLPHLFHFGERTKVSAAPQPLPTNPIDIFVRNLHCCARLASRENKQSEAVSSVLRQHSMLAGLCAGRRCMLEENRLIFSRFCCLAWILFLIIPPMFQYSAGRVRQGDFRFRVGQQLLARLEEGVRARQRPDARGAVRELSAESHEKSHGHPVAVPRRVQDRLGQTSLAMAARHQHIR